MNMVGAAIIVALFLAVCQADLNYTNDWAVRIDAGDDVANVIAAKHGFINMGQVGILVGYYHFRHITHPPRSNVSAPEHTSRLTSEEEVLWVEQQVLNMHTIRQAPDEPSDPRFFHQWHLLNRGQLGGPSGEDINVLPVWKQGVTGRGVTVVVVDTGIQHTHPDLRDNYDAGVSYDFDNNDPDPTPNQYSTGSEHGTRCAGEIAAEKNSVCGVGVAYDAKIGGIKLLDDSYYSSLDVTESKSLGYKTNTVDIYSNSWGPRNTGWSFHGPGTLTAMTLEKGAKEGRGGRGNIYFFAAGNDGLQDGDCNRDGYVSSIYTIAITALSGNGTKPIYTEQCTAITAVTYSGAGTATNQNITTTDVNSGCTDQHSGTSAATPLAAGMTALALQANPQLTWRDVQHLIARTSSVVDAGRNDWIVNGAGYYVSRTYGFGAMDAERLVNAARNWTGVGEQHECTVTYSGVVPRYIDGELSLSIRTNGCKGLPNEVRHLEHVVAKVSLASSSGSASVSLKSPRGTSSLLLHPRKNGYELYFTDWPFMTVHNWGEDPDGVWTLQVRISEAPSEYYYYDNSRSTLSNWTLTLYGTKECPLSNYSCHPECNGCSGPGNDNCLSCLTFSEKQNGTTHCVSSCSSGMMPLYSLNGRNIHCVNECVSSTYRDGNKCVPCDWSCLDCYKSSFGSNCSLCKEGYLFLQGQCVTSCPSGFYENNATKECTQCSSICETCSDAQTCQTCAYPFILYNDRCQMCPNGTYRQYDEFFHYYTCVRCHPSCKTCYASAYDECESCSVGFLYDNRCLSSCPPGTFYEPGSVYDQCRRCPWMCKSCTGDSYSNCTECDDDYFVYDGYCTDSCPTGTYRDYTKKTNPCQKCYPSCETCYGPDETNCMSCEDDQTLTRGTCYPSCYYGQYRAFNGSGDSTCEYCHAACRACYGPSDDECFTCSLGRVLYNDQCVDTCPNGTYPYSDSCQSCSYSCKTCYGSYSDECTSCEDGKFLYEEECRYYCPSGTYATGNGSSMTCQSCRYPCSSCNGSSSANCLSCRYEYVLYNHQCWSSCPIGTYQMQDYDYYSNTKTCEACHPSCAMCDGPDQFQCTGCAGNEVLRDNRCVVLTCTGSTYEVRNQSGEFCHACHSSCLTCNGSQADNCLSCDNGRIPFGYECVELCPSGYFRQRSVSTDEKWCERCDASCKTCSGDSYDNCLSCDEGRALNDRQCMFSCPAGMYSVQRQFAIVCEQCDASCKTCSGDSYDNCLSCDEGRVLNDRQCMFSCPAGMYSVQRQFAIVCEQCDASCKTCSGDSYDNCLSCDEGRVLNDRQCMFSCPAGMYSVQRQFAMVCEQCDPSCYSCSGQGSDSCLACNSGFWLSYGRCVVSCPLGTYHTSQNGQVNCIRCDDGCQHCNDRGCYWCQDGYEPSDTSGRRECIRSKPAHKDDTIFIVGISCGTVAAVVLIISVVVGAVRCCRKNKTQASNSHHLFDSGSRGSEVPESIGESDEKGLVPRKNASSA